MSRAQNKRILIAGIGNIFLGDDAFGVEVVRALATRTLPPEVEVMDLGIRSYDLAYALTDHYDVVILVDAAAQGRPPGTVYLLEPDLSALHQQAPASPDGHTLDISSVLQMAQSLGEVTGQLYLVGCEPAVLETEDGTLGLSPEARTAVPQAVMLLEVLIGNSVNHETKTSAGLVPG